MDTISREKLVDAAVKFLLNEKTKNSSESVKRTFLEKKGLTSEEITESYRRAGVGLSEATTNGIQHSNDKESSSWFSILKETVTIGSLLIGGVYVVYKFVKSYILPFLFGEENEDAQMRSIRKQFTDVSSEIKNNLEVIQSKLQSVEESVSEQQIVIRKISNEVEMKKCGEINTLQGQQALNDIKTDISALKAMLLGRKQFAPPPDTTPIIPAWQRDRKPLQSSTTSDKCETPQNKEVSPSSSEEGSSWTKLECIDDQTMDGKKDENTTSSPTPCTSDIEIVTKDDIKSENNNIES